jgi:hypothetical protein
MSSAGAGTGSAGAGMSSGSVWDAGGSGNTDLGCAAYATAQGCMDTCLTKSPFGVNAVCEDGAWVCPPGSIRSEDCPPESCYGTLDKCCNNARGADAARQCGADGMLAPCPAGFVAVTRGALCAPESTGVTSCDELRGLSCDDNEYRCTQGAGCGLIGCACESSADGSLLWRCYSRLC